MKPLTTDYYYPCLVCMKMQCGAPQAYRCRHEPDCETHILCHCEDRDHCSCNCSCKQFTAPSLTHSKIGAALHLEWEEEDGTTFNLDCDLNVPTISCGTPYDGGIVKIERYLHNEKPVNWIEETS